MGEEYYAAAKKMGYIEYSKEDFSDLELTVKGQEKFKQLKAQNDPASVKKGGYTVKVKL
ncbi:MAG: hypothetical protein Kapaf2KO_07330 [Candidatus Kapaibacteriales bacterium]